MVTLAFLIAALLDPVQAALVLALVIAYRGAHPILVAGTAAAVISETIIALAGSGYVWGELIAPRLVAALMQAAALAWMVNLVRSAARSVGASLGISRFSSGRAPAAVADPGIGGVSSASFEVPPSGSGRRRISAWQMRAYARRHLYGCDKEKMHP
jgi:hypothetical protein